MKPSITSLLLAACVYIHKPAKAGLIPPFSQGKPKEIQAQDWKLSKGKRSNDDDLRCADGGVYIGGIDRKWYLLISGPPRNRFYYSFTDFKVRSLQGSYEAKDGFALFTGRLHVRPAFKQDKKPIAVKSIRAGLNYRFVDNKVHFNVLWRTGKNTYRHERKWFEQSAAGWNLREHHQLIFQPRKRTGKHLSFQVKGRLLRLQNGKKIQMPVNQVAEYTKEGKYWLKSRNQPGWLPQILRPHVSKTPAKSWPECYHLGTVHFGWVRGFVFDEPPQW